MRGRWEAPGRVNLIGEHTDYNDGFVLPLAIPQRTRVDASARSDGRVRATSAQHADTPAEFPVDTRPGDVSGWAAYVAGVVWALRDRGHDVRGADLAVDGRVPLGAGLSSSAALECAVALALNDLGDLGLGRTDLARVAQRAENDYVGMPCGAMDQMASMHATSGHAVFLDTRTWAVEQVPLDLAAAGLLLLVVDTRAAHRLVDGEYAARRRDCERAATALGVAALRDVGPDVLDTPAGRALPDRLRRRTRHVTTENDRVRQVVTMLRAGLPARSDPRAVGPLLTASHESLRADYEVSVAELDVAVEAALRAGAHGARMTGAGFGGSVIALVERDAAEAVADAVRTAFAERAWPAPTHFTAAASAGAHGRVESTDSAP